MVPKNRNLLLLISAVTIILFLIVFLADISEVRDCKPLKDGLNVSEAHDNNFNISGAGHHTQIPAIYRMFLSPALIMIATVFAAYYFISRRLDEKLEKNMNLISKLIDKKNPVPKESTEKVNNAIVLKFFNVNERKILEKLIENNGATLQSEISRMDGMNKLRTHRTIKELERKGIIKTVGHGKTNRVILSRDVKDILLKK